MKPKGEIGPPKYAMLYVILFIVALALLFHFVPLFAKISIRWLFVGISLSGLALIIWYGVGAFFHNKIKRIIITLCIIALSIFIYTEFRKPPTTVYMKEDVLYIKPRIDITKQ